MLDVTRAYSRRAVDVDVEAAAADDRAIGALARLLDVRSGALEALDALVRESEEHRAGVGRSLQTGVESALTALVAGFSARRAGTRWTARSLMP